MIPHSFTQRLYILFLILSTTFDLVSCKLLSLMPNHKWSTLQLYKVLTLLNLTVIKPLLEEAVFYVDPTDLCYRQCITRTWSFCNTPRYCNHWQPRHHHVFWLDSAGWMMSPMFLSGRPSLLWWEWVWHYHPDVEPFCSLGGTVGARGGLCSVKFWLTFVNVTRLKTCAGWMRPGK